MSAASIAAAGDGRLVLIGAEPVAASLVTGDEAHGFQFEVAGTPQSVRSADLVRWGEPPIRTSRSEVRLVDGSRLPVAESWGGGVPVEFDDQRATVHVAGIGRTDVPRAALRTVAWRLSVDPQRRAAAERALARAVAAHPESDVVLLASGDVVTGAIVSAGRPPSRATNAAPPVQAAATGVVVTLESTLGRLALPEDRIAGLYFAPSQRNVEGAASSRERQAALVVGLRSGAELPARTLRNTDGRWSIVTPAGLKASVAAELLAALQGFGPYIEYLSDLPCDKYEQTSSGAIPWDLVRDELVAGGPLVIRGRRASKGLGIHGPARAEFLVPVGAVRFAAVVGIDDSTAGGGDAAVRVLTIGRGERDWTEAFRSTPLSGVGEPTAVEIDVTRAERMALVIDKGARGDELDRTAWIDARFELGDRGQ